MTPDDVAAVRAIALHGFPPVSATQALALCDALEEAWAERDRYRQDAIDVSYVCIEQRERAERAEASLEAARKWLILEQSAVEERDAALARVQALNHRHGLDAHAQNEIRAAIEGSD